DRVIVMDRGRIVEQGATKDLLARPRSQFGAGIAGLNLLVGVAEQGSVRTAAGSLVEGLSAEPLADGESAVAVFSPSAVGVYLEPPSGSPRNVFAATITELEPIGAQIRVRTAELSADVTASALAELGLLPGTAVHLSVKASEVALYAS
ncbi:MAG: TOBE domain-containing protein, partial [Aeromicrobium sp.]